MAYRGLLGTPCVCLQSYKLEREISNRVIAHLANNGAWFYVVTVVDKEVEETLPQY